MNDSVTRRAVNESRQLRTRQRAFLSVDQWEKGSRGHFTTTCCTWQLIFSLLVVVLTNLRDVRASKPSYYSLLRFRWKTRRWFGSRRSSNSCACVSPIWCAQQQGELGMVQGRAHRSWVGRALWVWVRVWVNLSLTCSHSQSLDFWESVFRWLIRRILEYGNVLVLIFCCYRIQVDGHTSE